MNYLTIISFIVILSILFIHFYYNKFEKNNYKCFYITHYGAYIFSIINIAFILSIQPKLSNFQLKISFLLLFLLISLIYFHFINQTKTHKKK